MEPRTGGLGGETYRLGVRRLLLTTLALNIVVVAGWPRQVRTLAAFAIAGFLLGACSQEMHLRISNEFGREHIASHAIIDEAERRLEGEFRKVTSYIHVEALP
jgi:hypothetical protein